MRFHTPSLASNLLSTLGLGLALATGCASQSASAPAGAQAAPATAASSVDATAAKVQQVLASPHRSEKNRVRDVHRHPVETLKFFGLRDDMNVVELWPGTGWYTEILAPVLKDRGKLTVTSSDPNGDPNAYGTKRAKEMAELLQKNAALFGTVNVAIVKPPTEIPLGPDGSADLVVTFRNLHNWMNDKSAEAVMAAAFRVLKSGGVLGVVEHRAKPGQDLKSGYVEESVAIRLAEAAGFKLAEKSEINANPKDTKDHPNGVWTLPPNLRGVADADREKYIAIGESDRMTLKFVKP